MKKLLAFLGSIGLAATSAITVVACGTNATDPATTPKLEIIDLVITSRELGTHSSVPTKAEILEQVKFLNPKLDLTQVEVTKQTKDSAIISPIENSTAYTVREDSTGVTVYFRINGDEDALIDINNALSVTDLGKFVEAPSKDEILQAAKNLNKDLDITQLEVIKIDNDNMNAKISVIDGSQVYEQGWVDVHYTIDARTDINDSIMTKDLKNFGSEPNLDELLARILAYNPNLNADGFALTTFGAGKATIKVYLDSKIYFAGEVEFNYTVQPVVDFSSLIKTSDLGNFVDTPSDQDLLNRLGDLNPGLITSEFEVVSKADGKVEIKVKDDSTYYNKPASLVFEYSEHKLVNVEDYLDNKDLKNFTKEPTNKDIIARIGAYNERVDTSQLEVKTINSANHQVTVSVIVKSTVYEPATITFTYTNQEVLSLGDIFTTKDLYNFTTVPTIESVLEKLHQLRPDFRADEITMSLTEDGKITITVNSDSTYYTPNDVIKFDYTIQQLTNINDAITTKDFNLKNFDPNSSIGVSSVINRLLKLNPNLNQAGFSNNVDLVNHTITISYKKFGNYYLEFSPIKFNYTVDPIIDLSDILKDLDLKNIPDPTDDNVLNRIKEVLDQREPKFDFKLDEVEVVTNADGKITLKVKDDATYYTPGKTIDLNYDHDQVTSIDKIFEGLDLKNFETEPDLQAIKDQIKRLDPNFKLDEVEITLIPSVDGKGTVHIKVKDGSTYYDKGEYDLNYTIGKKLHLEEVILHPSIGNFNQKPNEQQIIDRINTLPFDLKLDEVSLDYHDFTGIVTVNVKPNSTYYEQREKGLDLVYTVQQQVDLSSLIDVHDLQNFVIEPNVNNLTYRIISLNPEKDGYNLYSEGFIVTANGNGTAHIEVDPNSNLYSGDGVDFTYSVQAMTNLSELFPGQSLGNFNNEPNVDVIKERIARVNFNFKLDEVTVGEPHDGKVTLTVKTDSTYYVQGNIDLAYTVEPLIDLSNVISNLDLGEFKSEPNAQNVITRLLKNNPELKDVDLDVTDIKSGSVTITAKADSTYYIPGSSVDLTYKVEPKIRLTEIFGDNRKLGTILRSGGNSQQVFLDRLKLLYPTIDTTQITVEVGFPPDVTFKVKDGSQIYVDNEGDFNFTYELDTTLPTINDVIKNSYLTSFDNIVTEQDIYDFLYKEYPDLAIGDILITETDGLTKATIKVKDGSNAYQPGEMELTFKVVKDLATDLVTNQIGFIDTTSEADLTDDKILAQLKLNGLNPDLDLSQLEVKSINAPKQYNKASAVIGVKADATKYKTDSKEITVNFTRRINLHDVLTIRDIKFSLPLKLFNDLIHLDISTIKEQFIHANPLLNGDEVNLHSYKYQIPIVRPKSSAIFTVKVGSQVYFDESINVDFLISLLP